MRTLSKNKIPYESYSLFYILPYKREEESDEEILEKTITFLSGSSDIGRISINLDGHNIILSCLYEGYSSYYEYELIFELVGYDKGDKLMLAGYINQDIHELFEEIIKEKILPLWFNGLGLEELKNKE